MQNDQSLNAFISAYRSALLQEANVVNLKQGLNLWVAN